MRNFARSLRIVAAAFATLWLCAGQPARAGDGGADLGSLQTYIDQVCTFFSMSPCPQIPTISQAVLQVAAFVDVAPEAVRSSTSFAIPVGPYADAGNPSRPPALGCSPTGCVDPLNPITGLPIDPGVLSSLRPLAFVSAKNGKGPATPTQLYNPSADAFLYAVGGSSAANTNSSQPDTLLLFYDNPGRSDEDFEHGQLVAKISLPLTVLNSDRATERFVAATLQYKLPGRGEKPCSASTVTGNFSGSGTQTLSPTAIGINCAVAFGPSPVSPHPHAIFEVTIPMLITPSTDPVIFSGSPLNFGAPFLSGGGDFGFTPANCPSTTPGMCRLGTKGMSIGIGPNAGPFGAPASSTTPGTYALCANLPREGNGTSPVPSIAAFYAIGGDGVVRLSAPLAPTIPFVCPAGM
jgi:hypothetical protein